MLRCVCVCVCVCVYPPVWAPTPGYQDRKVRDCFKSAMATKSGVRSHAPKTQDPHHYLYDDEQLHLALVRSLRHQKNKFSCVLLGDEHCYEERTCRGELTKLRELKSVGAHVFAWAQWQRLI